MHSLDVIKYPPAYAASTTIENIDCGDGTGIAFDLVIPDIDEWASKDASQWRLSSPSADGTCDPTIGSDKVSYSSIDGDTCGVVSEDGDNFIYTFTISVSSTPGPGVTAQYDHDYTITCTYDKEKTGLQASFLPQHSVSDTDQGKK